MKRKAPRPAPELTRDEVGELSFQIEREATRRRLEVFLTSRDAGNALTRDSLREGIRLRPVIEIASDLATYADEALAIVNEEYHPQLHCKENCWYCCAKPGVLTTIPEFLRILEHVKATFGDEALAALKERARRYVGQIEGRSFNDSVNESVPCPLLLDGRCTVYEVRPLVCRGYNSTSVESCRKAHEDTSVLIPMFAILKDVTDGTTLGAAERLKAEGFNAALVDLGTALHVSLAADDELPERVVSGGSDLSAAEHHTWADNLWAAVRETARQAGIDL